MKKSALTFLGILPLICLRAYASPLFLLAPVKPPPPPPPPPNSVTIILHFGGETVTSWDLGNFHPGFQEPSQYDAAGQQVILADAKKLLGFPGITVVIDQNAEPVAHKSVKMIVTHNDDAWTGYAPNSISGFSILGGYDLGMTDASFGFEAPFGTYNPWDIAGEIAHEAGGINASGFTETGTTPTVMGYFFNMDPNGTLQDWWGQNYQTMVNRWGEPVTQIHTPEPAQAAILVGALSYLMLRRRRAA